MKTKMNRNGAIKIPESLRKKHNLTSDKVIHLIDYGGVLAIVPGVDDPIAEGAGMLKGKNSLTQMILEEHRKESRD